MTEIRQKLRLPNKGTVTAYGATPDGRMATPRKAGGPLPARAEGRGEGHDAMLFDLSRKNTKITVDLVNGEQLRGRLYVADRYTISLFREGKDDAKPTIVFKHAIAYFRLDSSENV